MDKLYSVEIAHYSDDGREISDGIIGLFCSRDNAEQCAERQKTKIDTFHHVMIDEIETDILQVLR